MLIYNEQMERIEYPDLDLGWLEDSVLTITHDAVAGVQEVWHYEIIAEYPNGGKDVKRVIDVPGVKASDVWTEEVPIQIYHLYTQEELDSRNEDDDNASVISIEKRVEELEKRFIALAMAYTDGVQNA